MSPRLLAPLAVLLGTAGCQSVRYVEAFHPEGPVYRVELRADAGTVRLDEGETLRVERAIKAPEGALQLSHRVVDGVLHLDARCSGLAPCAVDTTIELPPGLPVVVDLGTGRVEASDLSEVDILLDRGEVEARATRRLVARVGQGTVTATLDAGAEARVSVADGDIALDLDDDAWQLAVTAHSLELDGVRSSEEAAGSLELVAPGGTVRLARARQGAALALGE